MKKTIKKCDWCGKKGEEVFRTHFGTSQDYVRLMCVSCKNMIELHNKGFIVEDIDKGVN